MILAIVFGLLALFMAASAFAKGFMVWALLRHGAAMRVEKPARYSARLLYKSLDCALAVAVTGIAIYAMLYNLGVVEPLNFPPVQN